MACATPALSVPRPHLPLELAKHSDSVFLIDSKDASNVLNGIPDAISHISPRHDSIWSLKADDTWLIASVDKTRMAGAGPVCVQDTFR